MTPSRRSPRSYKYLIVISILILIILIQHYLYHNQVDSYLFSLCPYSYIIDDKHIMFDSPSHTINHYPEFICPQNFRNMADWIYGWPEDVFDEKVENSMRKIHETVAYLPHGSIVYIKTDSLSDFFSNIYPYFHNKFVLITGQGDLQSPGQYLAYLQKNDTKIIHWFGQNADIDATTNERFTPIPIGLNCFEMAESIRSIHKQYQNSTLPPIYPNSIDEPRYYIQPFDITKQFLHNKVQPKKIVLLNFSPDTDGTGLRRKLWKDLCENTQTHYAMCFTKPPGVDISSLPTIYKRNRQYPLWLSPRGNGLDCHRTWEALYLDIIPIVWHSTLDSLFINLPVLIINSSSEINEKFLRGKLYEISRKKHQQPSFYQYEKLRNSYWHEMILNKSRYASLPNPTQRNRCWRAKTIH